MDVTIEDGGRVLSVDGAKFHAIWLRDNAQEADTRDPGNGQRLITMADLPRDPKISAASADGDSISVTFDGEDARALPLGWLMAHRYDAPVEFHDLLEGEEPWASDLTPPQGDLADLQSNRDALRTWLADIRRFGFAKVTGVRAESEALFDVVDLFGYVRETNYGRHFEVRTEVNPVNLAYTGLGLQAHTDNPYRDPVPTLQILSCIENSATGGDSMVVDGFAAALRLREENPDAFALLAMHSVPFEYAGSAGVRLTSRYPMIELSPAGRLRTIRFNSRSIGTIDVPFDVMEAYYTAYRQFSDIIDDEAMQVAFKLQPGEAFIVDNTRVMHARRGYSGAGNRWLQGCYADKDGLLSTLCALEADA